MTYKEEKLKELKYKLAYCKARRAQLIDELEKFVGLKDEQDENSGNNNNV